ncbi:uncharacterized protein LOC144561941 [Carex rostrata]
MRYVRVQLETAVHLFYQCRYAKQVWEKVAKRLGRRIMVRGISVQQTWDKSWDRISHEGSMPKKRWAVLFMCVSWPLWKQRNDKNFRGKFKPPFLVADSILEDSAMWFKYCSGAGNKQGIG